MHTGWLQRLLGFFYGKPLKIIDRNNLDDHGMRMINKELKSQKLYFSSIEYIKTVAIGDYSLDFLNDIKLLVKNNSLPSNYERTMSWDKPHLHVKMINADGIFFLFAIVYPYEIHDDMKIVWMHEMFSPH